MKKILVVNNDEDTMSLLKSLLERGSYEVKFTGNKEEAIRLSVEGWPELILIDILQKEVVEELKHHTESAGIPLILMTGYQRREKAIELMVDDVIEKPFAYDLLEYKINRKLTSTV